MGTGPAIGRAAGLSADDRRRFTAIYETSFPPEEREAAEDLLAAVESGDLDCHVARQDGALVGLAVTLRLRAVPVSYLEDLAAAPALRGRSIGARLLDASHLAAAVGTVFEVERPEDAAGDERALR